MCGWLPTKTKAPLHFLIHRATVWGWKTPRDQGPWLKFGFPHLSGNLTSSRQAARKLENNRGRPRMSRAGASRENCSLMGILHDCAPCVGSGCHWNCQKMSKVDCDGAPWCHNLQIIPRSSLSCCAWILWPLPYDVPPDYCPIQWGNYSKRFFATRFATKAFRFETGNTRASRSAASRFRRAAASLGVSAARPWQNQKIRRNRMDDGWMIYDGKLAMDIKSDLLVW